MSEEIFEIFQVGIWAKAVSVALQAGLMQNWIRNGESRSRTGVHEDAGIPMCDFAFSSNELAWQIYSLNTIL